MRLADRVERTAGYFERVHREVFEGDPAANPALSVEVREARDVDGRHLCALITPWTVNGMVFPLATDPVPEWLELGERRRRVFSNHLDVIGDYWSVVLVSDLACLPDMESARNTVRTLAEQFHQAVIECLGLAGADVEDPARRAFLGLGRGG